MQSVSSDVLESSVYIIELKILLHFATILLEMNGFLIHCIIYNYILLYLSDTPLLIALILVFKSTLCIDMIFLRFVPQIAIISRAAELETVVTWIKHV